MLDVSAIIPLAVLYTPSVFAKKRSIAGGCVCRPFGVVAKRILADGSVLAADGIEKESLDAIGCVLDAASVAKKRLITHCGI